MNGLITIVGGSGFLGRYVVAELAKTGVRLRVVCRNPQAAAFLKPQGGLGQIQLMAGDIRQAAQMAAACDGADAVVNLVGILGGDFTAIQTQGAANVAAAAAAAGASALVHVSAIGADAGSPSAYGRTKGEGEAAVRAAFPGAVILRPSIVFGPEDGFVNRFAGLAKAMPFAIPVVSGKTRFQPVYVRDVAQGVVAALDPARAGKTFDLGGPRVISMRELVTWIAAEIRSGKPVVEVPDFAAEAMAKFGGWMPGAPITWDQWLMLQRDNVVPDGAAGLADLGIEATPLEAIAPGYLVRYRKQGRFSKRAA
jgi:uncharacterized protein YbjT (DUF2867 family)